MKDELETLLKELEAAGLRSRVNPSSIFSVPEEMKYLDTAKLDELENSFRSWAEKAVRKDVRLSRKRILLIFLLIRYTGARLGEILAMDDQKQIDLQGLRVHMGNLQSTEDGELREVQIPPELGREMQETFEDKGFSKLRGAAFRIDPGHVRRKFYERAEACGLPRELGNPNTIRRSRAIEWLKSNIPLPVVQKMLGHSTANLTASYLNCSPEEMRLVARHFIDRESRRKTSARNTFFGKISRIQSGDIQAEVELTTFSGVRLVSVITKESLTRLQLRIDTLASAEIKAPWVIIAKNETEPMASTRNLFKGTISKIIRGKITSEFVVKLEDGTDVCSVVTAESQRRLGIREKDTAWVMFDAFAVILNVD